jgi:oligopeptide transport system substrate-binding protein
MSLLLVLLCAQAEAPLRVSWGAPGTIDPAYASGPSEARIVSALFEGLTVLAPDGTTVEPGMAERWNCGPDGKRWTFRLREARWSDGSPVRAGDFVFAWRRALRVGGPFLPLFRQWRGVTAWLALGEGRPDPEAADLGFTATDDRTLQVDTEGRAPWLPHLLALHAFVPLHEATLRAHGAAWTAPGAIVTNGPYLHERATIAEILLRRRPDYWDPEAGKAPEAISILLHSPDVALRRYRQGAFEMLGAEQIPDAAEGEIPGLQRVELWGALFLRLNPATAPFRRPGLRRALAQGIDRDALAAAGSGPARRGLVPPGFPGYPEAAGIPFDRGAAVEGLWRESGLDLSSLPPLEILLPDAGIFGALASRLRTRIEKDLGWTVTLKVMQPAPYARALAEGAYQAALAGWVGDYHDPAAFLEPQRGHDEAFDRALAEAADEADPGRRLAGLHRAEARLLDGAALIPLSGLVQRQAVAAGLVGVRPNPFGHVAVKRLRRP